MAETNDTTVHPGEVPEPVGAYSQVRRLGPFLQTSGQIPRHTDRVGDIEGQTEQTLQQVEALLAAEGLHWGDVLMLRAFLADDKYFDGMDATFRRLLPVPYPPRTTVSAGLAPGVLVEIDALAFRS